MTRPTDQPTNQLANLRPPNWNRSVSVWWQIPQYVLVGASEVGAMVGSMELFYTQAPDAMRSTCAAVQLLATIIGSYLAAALVAIVQAASTSGGSPGWLADNINQGHVDYYFWCAWI